MCKIDEYLYIPGEGISAKSEGKRYLIGNETLLKNNGVNFVPPLTVGTYIHIAENNNYIGSFIFEDEIHKEAESMVYYLQKLVKKLLC